GGQTQGADILAGELTACGDLEGDGGTVDKLAGQQAELAGELHPQGDLFADLATGDVHGVGNELAGQCLEHGIGDVGAGTVLCLLGGCTQVRGDNNLRQLEQRGIGA